MQVQPVCSACVMFAAVLEAIEHRFHESMRATRAWIHENGARSLSRLLQPSHRLSRLAQPAQSCAYHEMQDVVMRMRAWKHIFRIAARARCERCIDLPARDTRQHAVRGRLACQGGIHCPLRDGLSLSLSLSLSLTC